MKSAVQSKDKQYNSCTKFQLQSFFFFQTFYLRFFPILYTLNVVCVLTKFDFLS